MGGKSPSVSNAWGESRVITAVILYSDCATESKSLFTPHDSGV